MRIRSDSHRVAKYKKETYMLIVLLASIVTWVLVFIVSSLVSIFFIDHTFEGWFIRQDEITHKWSFTLWSYFFIALSVVVTVFSILTACIYLKNLHMQIRAEERDIAMSISKRKLDTQRQNGFSFLLVEETNKKTAKDKKAFIVSKD